ncbi:hypothetical protein QDR37_03905 [Amnibacterium sp. CER49]|uniref:hypothetical protein n=1 Tax=Amnibacterium sp. CER49 TaxID=3039161 RepID=UPI00244BB1D8|nr:hypothetical protein [Amnibacterium sp. CER49]MDH2443086.1 hypothetical protein [Amnibacterium sp. CER49]
MTSVVRLRDTVVAPSLRVARTRTRADVLFAVVLAVLLAVHVTIFFAVLAIAPVTAAEQRSLDLLHLPVEVARALILPFHALLIVSLFVLGRRAAGRWAGLGAVLAILALNLRADPTAIVYGPSIATGGWVAASLLAASFVVLPRRRLLAACLLGAAAVFHFLTALALPGFLVALLLFPAPDGPRPLDRVKDLLSFAGAWLAAFAAGQLVWLADLGLPAYSARVAEFLPEFTPHPMVPLLEQPSIVFAAWHFATLTTVALAAFLFLAAGTGVVRYFVVPRPEEVGPKALVVARRLPIELWAAACSTVLFAAWWTFSGLRVVIDPNLPALVAVVPLITAMAYRGAKWLLTVNRFWALCGALYLIGLILARSIQLLMTLIQAFSA